MPLTPDRIMQVGLGFFAAKALQTAVDHEVFTYIGAGARTGEELRELCGWHPRGVYDLLDALVALALLEREGEGADARYSNTPETALFLDKGSEAYIGGMLEMASARLYRFWGDLGEAMRSGQPQNEVKHSGRPIFTELCANPELLRQFLGAMAGISRGNFLALAQRFDFARYATLCDVGGASGLLSVCVARAHPGMRCTSYDLPVVEPFAKQHIAAAGLSQRVSTASGDFLVDPLPSADVITMSMVLHDWNLEKKKQLIRAAYDALPDGGAFVVVEMLIDDARRENVMGLMMSLNMLIEIGDAFDYTAADFQGWCREVGFREFEVIPLAGPASAAVAYK